MSYVYKKALRNDFLQATYKMMRSDPMSFCDIYLQPEVAYEALSRLGEIGCVQFVDANKEVAAFQRNYVTEMCRCDEMERKLRLMEVEMVKDNIYVTDMTREPQALQPNEMMAFENVLEKWEDDIEEMSGNQKNLLKNQMELAEMYYVLTHLGPIIGESELLRDPKFSAAAGETGIGGHLFVITGVVRRSRCFAFETMIWRLSHGNIFYRHAAEDQTLEDPATGAEVRKVAFIIICQGEQLNNRMKKVCTGFRANIYPCPATIDEREEMMNKLSIRLRDLKKVLKKTSFHRCKALRTVGRQFKDWMASVKKAKAIYHHLNLFSLDITKKCLIGQCWVPTKDLKKVQDTLDASTREVEAAVPSFMSKTGTTETPPTFHRTNKFTHGFQALINAYGDATYRELNPGRMLFMYRSYNDKSLFTIITFPFLFAVMFGDLGHAVIMFVFAYWMVRNEKKFAAQRSTNEIWNIFFGGRYVIMLMGLFSMYTGFVYNDVFSKRMLLGKPTWINIHKVDVIQTTKYLSLGSISNSSKVTYWAGIDPVWLFAKNKIVFENSLKMKLSIIIGVIHMIFGIVLSLFNHINFKHKHAIFLEFLPQVIFLTCLFLYLVFMMYFKWFAFSMFADSPKRGSSCAPLLLIYFIDMVLMSTTKPVAEGCDAYMYEGQKQVQSGLLFTGLVCVPIMLFGSPCYLNNKNKKKRAALTSPKSKHRDMSLQKKGFRSYQPSLKDLRKYEQENPQKVAEEKTFAAEMAKYPTFGEMMITQGVHTIEFVLSTVSHTASYLRLWALSLAHAQLSEMLWTMIFGKIALSDTSRFGAVKVFAIFAVWASFTVAIMVLMEGMSAFLHTLRLHWVEFMSKFFIGGGYNFNPFSFKTILYSDDAEDKSTSICAKRAKLKGKEGGEEKKKD